jgi:hypothetical protein
MAGNSHRFDVAPHEGVESCNGGGERFRVARVCHCAIEGIEVTGGSEWIIGFAVESFDEGFGEFGAWGSVRNDWRRTASDGGERYGSETDARKNFRKWAFDAPCCLEGTFYVEKEKNNYAAGDSSYTCMPYFFEAPQ